MIGTEKREANQRGDNLGGKRTGNGMQVYTWDLFYISMI